MACCDAVRKCLKEAKHWSLIGASEWEYRTDNSVHSLAPLLLQIAASGPHSADRDGGRVDAEKELMEPGMDYLGRAGWGAR